MKVGKGSWLGIGSIVSNNINIASGMQSGCWSVVVKDITKPGIYVGVPVREYLMMKVLVLANFGMGLYNFRKELLEELIKQNMKFIFLYHMMNMYLC